MNKNGGFWIFFGCSALFFLVYVAWDNEALRVYQYLKIMIALHFLILFGAQIWNRWNVKKEKGLMQIKRKMELWWMTIFLAFFWWGCSWLVQIKFMK